MFSITASYVPFFGFLLVGLSLRIIFYRRKYGVGLGDGGYPLLHRSVRVHSNFIEYVPFILLTVYLLEKATDASILIHILCSSLLVGRLLHAYGVSQVNETLVIRQAGMGLTFIVLISASLRLLFSMFFDG